MKKVLIDNTVINITDHEFLELKDLLSKTLYQDLDDPSEDRDKYNEALHRLKLKYMSKKNTYFIKNQFKSLY